MDNQLRIGVVGVGVMGRNHARLYHESTRSRLVAVADVDRQACREIAARYNCREYAKWEEMLEAERLDGVSVCVPTSLHYRVGRAVLSNGIHLLMEKPLCDTVAHASRLLALARQRRCTLMVGHIERYNPAVGTLRRIIHRGGLGELICIQANRVGISPPRIKDANVLVDLAIHDIDICAYLTGHSPALVALNDGRAVLRDRSDHVEIMLHYGTVLAIIAANWITPIKIRTLKVTGTKGYAELDFISQEVNLHRLNRKRSFADYADFVERFGSSRTEKVPIDKEEPLKAELQVFLDRIRRGDNAVDTFALDCLRIAAPQRPARKRRRATPKVAAVGQEGAGR
jgi:UDP-N-acetylglucosamine 3-dehydrogenase